MRRHAKGMAVEEASASGGRDRYAEILDATPDFVGIADAAGNTISVNPAGRRMLGISEDEDLSRTHISHYHPEWVRKLILHEGVPAAIRDGVWEGETALLSRDGREIPVSQVILAHRVEAGEVGYLSTVARDLTDRKRAEEAVREAETFSRSALDGLSACVAVLDEAGTIIATNRAWREFGAANGAPDGAEISEGANYLAVCDGASGAGSGGAAAFAEGLRSVASGREDAFELEYPCHSPDERRWFVGRVTRFPGSYPTKVVVAHENVTQRKLAEQELHTRARQQRAVADLGRRALTADASALMEEAVVLVAETLGVRYCKVLELLPDGDELLLVAGVGWREGLVGKATVGAGRDSQAGYTLLSNEPVVVEDLRAEERFSGPPLLWEHGVVSGMSTIIRGRGEPFGVLGVHAAEARTFTDDDIHFLRAVANVLAAAVEREQAERALHDVREAERGRMARDLHDGALQDITYIVVEVQLAQLFLDDPEANERLEKATNALRRVAQELRETVYDLHPADASGRSFSEVLEELLANTRRMAPQLETELSVDDGFPDDLPDVTCRELLRVVQEAITNARRHAGASRVSVSLSGDGQEVRAEVADDGKGFDPRESHGGLGRTSMLERATALGGSLEIESAPGKGTRVRFAMPRSPCESLLGPG